MRTLYIDCFSGLAGDMMLGTLLDLGATEGITLPALREALASLDLPPWQIEAEERLKCGIRGLKVMISASGIEEAPSIPYDPSTSANRPPLSQEGLIENADTHAPFPDAHSGPRAPHGHEHGFTYREIRQMLGDSTLERCGFG